MSLIFRERDRLLGLGRIDGFEISSEKTSGSSRLSRCFFHLASAIFLPWLLGFTRRFRQASRPSLARVGALNGSQSIGRAFVPSETILLPSSFAFRYLHQQASSPPLARVVQ